MIHLLGRLRHARWVSTALIVAPLCVPALQAQVFKFNVRHHHLLRDCRGVLEISDSGVEYRTPDKKDARKWKFDEIQTIEVNSAQRISLVTYEDQKRFAGKDRVFEFDLVGGKVTPAVSEFLLRQVKRPMQLAVLPADGKPVFELRVKHLHTISGAMGVLSVFPDRVVFRSDREGDSRFWRLDDIERFSQPDRYRFQIVSHLPKTGGPTEVYNFELLKDPPEGLYDYLWVRLHPSSYYPDYGSRSLK